MYIYTNLDWDTVIFSLFSKFMETNNAYTI